MLFYIAKKEGAPKSSYKYFLYNLFIVNVELRNRYSINHFATRLAVPALSPSLCIAGRRLIVYIDNLAVVNLATVNIVLRTGAINNNEVTSVTSGAVVLLKTVDIAVTGTVNVSTITVARLSTGGAVVDVVGVSTSGNRYAVSMVSGVGAIIRLTCKLLGLAAALVGTCKNVLAILTTNGSDDLNELTLNNSLGPYVCNLINSLTLDIRALGALVYVSTFCIAGSGNRCRVVKLIIMLFGEGLAYRYEDTTLVSTVLNSNTYLITTSGSGDSGLEVVVVLVVLSTDALLSFIITITASN